MPKPKSTNPDAKTRRDSVISFTAPTATATLLESLAQVRGITRSELLRYLIVKDALENHATILVEAITETTQIRRGRPSADAPASFLDNETVKREAVMSVAGGTFDSSEGIEIYKASLAQQLGCAVENVESQSTELLNSIITANITKQEK